MVTEFNEARLRSALMQYPGATEATVEEAIRHYALRATEKRMMIQYRGMTNAMAERALDRLGYQRPPGWRSVFFFPDSWRPRTRYIVVGAIVILVALLAGCVSTEMASYVGKPAEELTLSYGPPVNEVALPDGGKAMQYLWGGSQQSATVATGTGAPAGAVQSQGCLISYILRKDDRGAWVVTDYRYPSKLVC